jgi:7-cyano-7-deazaguanine synthase
MAKVGIASKHRIEIKAPLLKKNKSQIISLGVKLGVPFSLTRSCYRAGKNPCGECDSCYYRAKGFKEAGLSDPLVN